MTLREFISIIWKSHFYTDSMILIFMGAIPIPILLLHRNPFEKIGCMDSERPLIWQPHNSIANTLELRLSCTNPSICWVRISELISYHTISQMYKLYNVNSLSTWLLLMPWCQIGIRATAILKLTKYQSPHLSGRLGLALLSKHG